MDTKLKFHIDGDASGIVRASKETEKALGDVDGKAKKVSRSVSESMAGAFTRAGDKMRSVGASLTMFVTTPLIAAAGAAVKLAGDFEQTTIAFNTMLGSSQKAAVFLKDLEKFAAKTPFEFKDLTDAAKRMLALGFSADQVLPTLQVIGDAVAGLGGGSQMIDRVTLALGQMQAKGKVSAQEMNQLAESGIPAWALLAEKIGTSIPEAMELAGKGAIEASVAIPAILEGMSARFGGMMDQQSKTLLGQLSNMKDEAFFIIRDVGTSLLPVAKSAMENFVKPLLEGVKAVAKWFTNLSAEQQQLIFKTAAVVAAIGPLTLVLGTMAGQLSNIITLSSRLIGVLSGGQGLIVAVKNLGFAAAVAGAIFAGWKIAEWIDQLDLFGRHARVAENEIIRQAEAFKKEAIDIGAVRDAMAKYQSMLDQGVISQGTFNNILADLTKQRPTEALAGYRDRMQELVDKFKAAHPELFKTKEALEAATPPAKGLAGAFGGLNVEVGNANEALDAFNASYWESFKGAENIPRAPWDTRIIQLEYYLGKVNELSLAESAALKAREAVDVPLMDPILLELSGEGVEGFVKQAVDGADEIIASFDDLRRAAEDGTWRLNEYLAKAREALADGTGGFDEIAATALGGYLSGYENVLTGVADSFGNFFDYLADGFARAIAFSDDFGEALKDIGRNAVGILISSLVRLGIQWALNKAIMSAADKGVLAENAAQAAATATAWAPAAALASLATLGANAAPATAAIGMTSAVSMGVAATSRLSGFKDGGFTGWGGKDEVAGFVHGQEFVMNEKATKEYLPLLQAMNSPAPINNRYETMPVARALSQPSINISVANYGSSKQFTVEQIDENNIRIIARDEAYNVLSQRGPEVIAADLAYANSRTSKALARHTTARRGDR